MVNIAISTSTFFNLPFNDTLKVIKQAGYEYIELTPYWKGYQWEIAQHLKGFNVQKILSMIDDAGLKYLQYMIAED